MILWLPNSRCIELIFLNSNSFFCIPQCSMEENCLAPEAYRLRHESPNFSMESRRLLRFTTSIQNIGDADFRPFIPKTAWEWHACHMHYHSMEVSMNAYSVQDDRIWKGLIVSFHQSLTSVVGGNCPSAFLLQLFFLIDLLCVKNIVYQFFQSNFIEFITAKEKKTKKCVNEQKRTVNDY